MEKWKILIVLIAVSMAWNTHSNGQRTRAYEQNVPQRQKQDGNSRIYEVEDGKLRYWGREIGSPDNKRIYQMKDGKLKYRGRTVR